MPTNPSVSVTPTDGNLGVTSTPTKRIGIIGYTTTGQPAAGSFTASGGGGSLTATGTPLATAYDKTLSVEIRTAEAVKGSADGSYFDWKLDGITQASNLSCSNGTSLSTIGLTLSFPVSGLASNHSWTADITGADITHTADSTELATNKGRGAAVDFGMRCLNQVRGLNCSFVTAVASTPGTAGSVTTVRNSGSDGTVTVVSNTANDSYEIVTEILTSTTSVDSGDGEFRYSLDGGDVFSAPIAIPDGASPQKYQFPNTGVTIAFTDGSADPTFEDGDTFSFDCTGPSMSTSDVGQAWDALMAEANQYTKNFLAVFVVGTPASASASQSLFSTLDTKVQALSAAEKFTRVIAQAGFGTDETKANLISSFASQSSAQGRVAMCAYDIELDSTLDTGKKYRRGMLFEVARMIARNPIHVDLGKVRDDGKGGGPMLGVSGIYDSDNKLKTVFNTEWQDLDTARFITPRTWIPGGDQFYVTQGNTMAADGSDYGLLQFGLVMDAACRVVQDTLFQYANDNLRTDASTGYIDALEADGIDDVIKRRLSDRLVVPENIQEVVARVRRDVSISSVGLKARVFMRPFSYVKTAEADLGFVEVTANL